MTDLDALTAYVVANPDDYTGWSAYSDCCQELGNDAWAALALKFRDADVNGRAELIAEHWQRWPAATGLAMKSMTAAMERMAEVGQELVKAFAAAGAGIARAMAPTIEAIGRIGRGEETTD